MKKELQDQLYNKYPKLFGQKDLPMQQTCMCWGIETGDGWYRIIEKACGLIQWRIDQSRKSRVFSLAYNRRLQKAINGNTRDLERYYESFYSDKSQIPEKVKEEVKNKRFRPVESAIPQVQFTQIKEKFGTLRIYTNSHDDYVYGVISMAESMSAVTCEVCGVPGRSTAGGWIETLCNRCARNSGRELISDDDEEQEEETE